MRTLLITGFGPFPGVPFNPTGPLAARLAALRRPALAGWRRIAHVFPTSYPAVDRELPELIAKHRPDALLMFGVAGRTRQVRIETLARNRLSTTLPDAARSRTFRMSIATAMPAALAMRTPGARLLAAARMARVPARLSNDAGRYLCNYLCWRATEAGNTAGGPRLAAFVHVPKVRRSPRPLRRAPATTKHRAITLGDLGRAGEAILVSLAAAAACR